MQFIKAVIDLVMLAEYQTHNEDTLEYLNQTISQIGNLKKYFYNLQSKNKHTKKEQFNFSKFHVLVHYTDFIKKFETLNEFDSVTFKTDHKDQIKELYNCMNKQNNFLVQITYYSFCQIN